MKQWREKDWPHVCGAVCVTREALREVTEKRKVPGTHKPRLWREGAHAAGHHRKLLKSSMGTNQKVSASKDAFCPVLATETAGQRDYLQDFQTDVQGHLLFFLIFINI